MDIRKFKKSERGPKIESLKVQVPEQKVEKESSLDNIGILKGEKEIKIPEKFVSKAALAEEVSKTSGVLEKNEMVLQIEKILEEDLEDIYFNLPPETQKEFKEKGEETASKIHEFLDAVKIKTKEIIIAISHWLKIIPGVNKFFVDQESKIKADKILKLKHPK